jgi:hypothetical protein
MTMRRGAGAVCIFLLANCNMGAAAASVADTRLRLSLLQNLPTACVEVCRYTLTKRPAASVAPPTLRRCRLRPCPFRKSYPHVLVMQSTEDGP